MIDVFNRNIFLIRENFRLLKAEFDFDICDPETGNVLLKATEDKVRGLIKLFRFSSYKTTTPFDIKVGTLDGQPALRIAKGIPKVVLRIKVFDSNGELIGVFRQKPFSISGAFDVLDAEDRPVCRLKGGLGGWNFSFMTPDGIELARIVKKWTNLGKELCTSADDYILVIDEAVPRDSMTRQLVVASALCVGLTMKIEVL